MDIDKSTIICYILSQITDLRKTKAFTFWRDKKMKSILFILLIANSSILVCGSAVSLDPDSKLIKGSAVGNPMFFLFLITINIIFLLAYMYRPRQLLLPILGIFSGVIMVLFFIFNGSIIFVQNEIISSIIVFTGIFILKVSKDMFIENENILRSL
jgi:hypothetical protein